MTPDAPRGPRAAIDVGSNTLLLLVVDGAGAVLHDEARIVGLGAGLGDRGMLRPDRMSAAEEILAAFAQTARRLGVEPWAIRAVATSAARRAMNAETFFQRVQRTTGVRVRIVSGEEEARLTWVGGLVDLPPHPEPLLVVDIGGGSTEIVQGERAAIRERISLELGSVRLTERHFGTRAGIPDRYEPEGLAALRRHVEVELDRVPLRTPPATVVGVAGTVTTLAATALGLTTWDAARVHGSALTLATLQGFVGTLATLDREGRRAFARVSPERADWLLAGAVLLERLLDRTRQAGMLVSDRGLRFGLVA